jgi:glutaredoxin 3
MGSEITIYSRDACIYCDMAIRLAVSKKMNLTVLKLDKDYSIEEFTAKFMYAKTVPQIILNGEHIGGYQDLKDLV